MATCPVCGDHIPPDHGMAEEQEHYEGPEAVHGLLEIWLPFCGQSKACNRVTAANKMDELAQPFMEAVGNG